MPLPTVYTTIEISAKLELVSPVLGASTTSSDVFVETCSPSSLSTDHDQEGEAEPTSGQIERCLSETESRV